jgi:signal transduction histidine kinase
MVAHMERAPDASGAPVASAGRLVVPVLAVLATVGAVLPDPGRPWEISALLVAGGALLTAGLVPRCLPALAPVTIAGAVAAQSSGHLEVGLFLLSFVAMLLTLDPLTWPRGLLVALAIAAPFGFSALWPPADYNPGIWTLGVAVPAALGWAVGRDTRLSDALTAARLELARQQATEERRRIARDVHDLVGHGLAAMLVQVASARHVLRRDPDAADEALATAEEVGRRSMRELRSTITHLRDGQEPATALPGLDDVERLVTDARARGLAATLTLALPECDVDTMTALTAYRIAQEALTNAERHAPTCPTEVALDEVGGELRLRVLSRGARAVPGPAGFGVRGMRERAEAVGGRVTAGPAPHGWLVDATLPVRSDHG